ncbi:hypothetical protein BGZ73_003278 [Actinomortierella ambigua]|nr:hypothetical protein BGZ73_003278 [Actinomortierella ambigua]
MNIDSGLLDGVRVEDMSNAELYQYLFKADLDEELLPLEGLEISTLPSTAALDAAAAAAVVVEVSSSPSTSSLAAPSPSSLQLSPGPPPPYSPPSSDSMSIGSSSPQEQPLHLAVVSSPTLLSSSSFSYRQLTPNMPPSKPIPSPVTLVPLESSRQHEAALAKLPASNPAEASANAALAASMSTSANAGSYIPAEQMNVWMQRFQQLQQLQQMHHKQQQELLASRLLGTINEDSLPSSSSPSSSSFQKQRSASPAGSSSSSSSSSTSPTMVTGTPEKDKDVFYPSPPMKDDMAMDSDSEGHGGANGGQDDEDRDPLKPSASELKKMTSKERRQLRNKLSARNFRVRRKEYIGSLENQVKEAKKENAELQRKLVQAELNIQFLRQELETVRLQQSLFTDSTMTRDHANLLASLLNPSTEIFPSSSPSTLSASSSSATSNLPTLNSSALLPTAATGALTATQQSTWQQQQELMNSIHFNNMTILNNTISSLPSTQQSQQQSNLLMSTSTAEASTSTQPAEPTTASIQPFIPFDSNWELSVNRAELPDTNIDPKQGLSTRSDEDIHELLVRYEAIKQEYERDEQMRMELKAYSEERLARSFVVMPPLSTKTGMPASTWSVLDKSHAEGSQVMLQAIVYIMMMQLTKALFEAATLSKTQIVDMFQKMDAPLRSRMLLTQSQDNEEELAGRGRSHCKFSQWREAWIRKCWPSFYNNRQRLCQLIKNHLCCQQEDQDAVQMARLMEEGAASELALETPSFAERARYYLPDWLKCPNIVEMDRLAQKRREERNAIIEAARIRQQQKQQQQQQLAEAVMKLQPLSAVLALTSAVALTNANMIGTPGGALRPQLLSLRQQQQQLQQQPPDISSSSLRDQPKRAVDPAAVIPSIAAHNGKGSSLAPSLWRRLTDSTSGISSEDTDADSQEDGAYPPEEADSDMMADDAENVHDIGQETLDPTNTATVEEEEEEEGVEDHSTESAMDDEESEEKSNAAQEATDSDAYDAATAPALEVEVPSDHQTAATEGDDVLADQEDDLPQEGEEETASEEEEELGDAQLSSPTCTSPTCSCGGGMDDGAIKGTGEEACTGCGGQCGSHGDDSDSRDDGDDKDEGDDIDDDKDDGGDKEDMDDMNEQDDSADNEDSEDNEDNYDNANNDDDSENGDNTGNGNDMDDTGEDVDNNDNGDDNGYNDDNDKNEDNDDNGGDGDDVDNGSDEDDEEGFDGDVVPEDLHTSIFVSENDICEALKSSSILSMEEATAERLFTKEANRAATEDEMPANVPWKRNLPRCKDNPKAHEKSL